MFTLFTFFTSLTGCEAIGREPLGLCHSFIRPVGIEDGDSRYLGCDWTVSVGIVCESGVSSGVGLSLWLDYLG